MSRTGRTPPGTDRDVLRGAAYADPGKLDDRRSIYAYRLPPFDLHESVLDQLDGRRVDRVLDVGCGPGTYLDRLRSRLHSARPFGADLSSGMLASTVGSGITAVACADASSLPFVDQVFDVVMANHMLYHVAAIGGAVREARRVLADGGTFLAVTNAEEHFREFDALLAELSGRDSWWRPSHRFTLGNGRRWLEAEFDAVETVRFDGELRVPTVAPVVRFARSMRDLSGADYDDARWEALMDELETRVQERIDDEGAFVTRTDTGVFVCR